MKHVFRFIGVVVVLVVLAALVLYFLNGQGYIRGPLSTWITNMQTHFNGAVEDTQETINEFRGHTPDPRPDSLQTPELNGLEDLATAEPVQVPEITPEPTPEA
ncbi:MAG: hypothetical protein IKI52_09880 [Clostridia bacterium]|jgi:hypothetical protein|nr:hypothetical protein [Clostridia bacterium]